MLVSARQPLFFIYDIYDLHPKFYDSDCRNFIRIKTGEVIPITMPIKGLIAGTSSGVGLLYDVSEDFIAKAHLRKTNQLVKFAYGDEYLPLDENGQKEFKMYREFAMDAIVNIFPTGKVDLILLRYPERPIQKTPQEAKYFDWIEGFYKMCGLDQSSQYKTQPDLVELYKNRQSNPLWRKNQYESIIITNPQAPQNRALNKYLNPPEFYIVSPELPCRRP